MEKQIAKMEDEATYSVTTAPAVSSDDAIIETQQTRSAK